MTPAHHVDLATGMKLRTAGRRRKPVEGSAVVDPIDTMVLRIGYMLTLGGREKGDLAGERCWLGRGRTCLVPQMRKPRLPEWETGRCGMAMG